ncbi:MAG: hypothetical protein H6718_06880 [Polyangiaceae bacterium]|nr:hypothetical protein [Polyangiaceae bacterium]
MAKKAKQLTKKERKAQQQAAGQEHHHHHHQQHIHCIACGRHMEPTEFNGALAGGRVIVCDHGSQFPACAGCVTRAKALVAEHDRTGKPVAAAQAWH